MKNTKMGRRIELNPIDGVLKILPPHISDEVKRHIKVRTGLTEIRLRRYGTSELSFGFSRISLTGTVGQREIEYVFSKITDNSLFAHKESLERGYVSYGGGIRVGVVGSARYNDGAFVGISDISALNIRIPTAPIEIPAVENAFGECKRGLLIYSPPGVGKTTALKSLVMSLGGGANRKNVSVIDERREFPPELFVDGSIDVYYGYPRVVGMEMALRSDSPEVLVIDEISGREEAALLSEFLLSGVKLAASVHADSYGEIFLKPSLKPLLRIQAFDGALGIKRLDYKYVYDFRRIND